MMKRGLSIVLLIGGTAVSSAFVSPIKRTSTTIFTPQISTPLNNVQNIQSCNSRRTSSSTSLSAIPINTSTITKFYKGFPLIAGFMTAGTKAFLADSLAQYKDVCTTKFNVKRNLAMVLYSGTILGCTCEIMYNRIFPLIFGPTLMASDPGGLARAIKMVLFDGFINAPIIWLPPAYIAQALVYNYPKREAIEKYITDVKENGLLKKYWSLWLPASLTNFCFIPPHFRIAFVAGVSFFWMIVLSIVANNDKDPVECPLEPEPGLVDPRALE